MPGSVLPRRGPARGGRPPAAEHIITPAYQRPVPIMSGEPTSPAASRLNKTRKSIRESASLAVMTDSRRRRRIISRAEEAATPRHRRRRAESATQPARAAKPDKHDQPHAECFNEQLQ